MQEKKRSNKVAEYFLIGNINCHLNEVRRVDQYACKSIRSFSHVDGGFSFRCLFSSNFRK